MSVSVPEMEGIYATGGGGGGGGGGGREGSVIEDIPLVEFMYLVFIRILRESYRRRLTSLLMCLCDVFRALINFIVC